MTSRLDLPTLAAILVLTVSSIGAGALIGTHHTDAQTQPSAETNQSQTETVHHHHYELLRPENPGINASATIYRAEACNSYSWCVKTTNTAEVKHYLVVPHGYPEETVQITAGSTANPTYSRDYRGFSVYAVGYDGNVEEVTTGGVGMPNGTNVSIGVTGDACNPGYTAPEYGYAADCTVSMLGHSSSSVHHYEVTIDNGTVRTVNFYPTERERVEISAGAVEITVRAVGHDGSAEVIAQHDLSSSELAAAANSTSWLSEHASGESE